MNNVNRVTLIGQLAANAEKFEYQPGKFRTQFRVATNYSWKNAAGEGQKGVDFHRVVCWQKLADAAGTLTKGEPVLVEGKLRNFRWEAEDGSRRTLTEVLAYRILPVRDAAATERVQAIELAEAEDTASQSLVVEEEEADV